MTPQKTKTKSTAEAILPFLTYHDGKPCAELTAFERAYPLRLSNGRELLVWLEQPRHKNGGPDNRPLINLYDDENLGTKLRVVTDEQVNIIGGDTEGYKPYFSKHFSRLTKLDGTDFKNPVGKEAQLEWVLTHDPGQRIVAEVMTTGVLGATHDSSAVEDVAVSDDLEEEIQTQVGMAVSVWDVEKKRVVKIPMVNHIRDIFETDSRKWRKATGETTMHREKQEFKRQENHSLIADLYISICDGLEGALYEGEPCTASNKNDWLKQVSYNWMYLVTNRVFRGSQSKN